MPDDSPMQMLRSDDPFVRLAGARALARSDISQHIADIRRIRTLETDSWVRAALDRSIHRWESASAVSDPTDSWISIAGSDELQDIRAVAIQSVTITLLHEILPIVGDISTAARGDVPDYKESATRHYIERLRAFLRTIKTLHDAAASPQVIEFDLVDLINREIVDGGFDSRQILATRTDSVVVYGDPDLLSLALQNAFRNAVEASELSGKSVIVNCGYTATEAWVVVLDEGIGLPDGSNLKEPGVTKKSKDEHFGWGLTIADQAMHSLSGNISLSRREYGGTMCEIRWANSSPQDLEPDENPTD